MAGDQVNNHDFKFLYEFFSRLIERARAKIMNTKTDEITIEPLPIECKMKVFQS